MAKKKQSKKHKQWLQDKNHITKQKSKPIKNRIMGNCKEACYQCGCAGYWIKEFWELYLPGILSIKREFIPFCWSSLHKGRICNVNINKFFNETNQEIRQKKYEEYLKNKEVC